MKSKGIYSIPPSETHLWESQSSTQQLWGTQTPPHYATSTPLPHYPPFFPHTKTSVVGDFQVGSWIPTTLKDLVDPGLVSLKGCHTAALNIWGESDGIYAQLFHYPLCHIPIHPKPQLVISSTIVGKNDRCEVEETTSSSESTTEIDDPKDHC